MLEKSKIYCLVGGGNERSRIFTALSRLGLSSKEDGRPRSKQTFVFGVFNKILFLPYLPTRNLYLLFFDCFFFIFFIFSFYPFLFFSSFSSILFFFFAHEKLSLLYFSASSNTIELMTFYGYYLLLFF